MPVRRVDDSATERRTIMNQSYGYQLYQAQRITPRAEALAADAQRGRQAAAVARGARRLASGTRTARALISRAYRRHSPSRA
jgi:hypothetical protein